MILCKANQVFSFRFYKSSVSNLWRGMGPFRNRCRKKSHGYFVNPVAICWPVLQKKDGDCLKIIHEGFD
jgi:hypothetical protein